MRSFTCTAPASVAEAVDAITAAGPGARFLADGTTLYDLMKLGVERPSALVDVSQLAGLAAALAEGEGRTSARASATRRAARR